MNHYFIGLGSNIQPDQNIPASLKSLARAFSIIKTSSIYETDPVGPSTTDHKFWNAAVEIESSLDDQAVSQALRKIEADLGRVRVVGDRYAPRTIDLDLLPEPGYEAFAFNMIPLAEIAPDHIDSKLSLTFEQLAKPFAESAKKFRKIERADIE